MSNVDPPAPTPSNPDDRKMPRDLDAWLHGKGDNPNQPAPAQPDARHLAAEKIEAEMARVLASQSQEDTERPVRDVVFAVLAEFFPATPPPSDPRWRELRKLAEAANDDLIHLHPEDVIKFNKMTRPEQVLLLLDTLAAAEQERDKWKELADDVVGDAKMLYHSADMANEGETTGKAALRLLRETNDDLTVKLTAAEARAERMDQGKIWSVLRSELLNHRDLLYQAVNSSQYEKESALFDGIAAALAQRVVALATAGKYGG